MSQAPNASLKNRRGNFINSNTDNTSPFRKGPREPLPAIDDSDKVPAKQPKKSKIPNSYSTTTNVYAELIRIIKESQNKAQTKFHEQLVQVITAMDDRVCDICEEYENEEFDEDDPNAPDLPLHPSCRCYFDEAVNESTGKKIRIFRIENKKQEFNQNHDDQGRFASGDGIGEISTKSSDGKFETGKAVSFTFMHNTSKSPNMGSRFGQDIEPSGQYVIQKDPNTPTLQGWKDGKMTFKNPLVIKWSSDDNNYDWKQKLSSATGGLKGKELSNNLKSKGYDGIVTIDHGHTSEIVNLQTMKKEFNPNHDPDTGQFTFADGGGVVHDGPAPHPLKPTSKLGNVYPKGRIGGRSNGKPWNPVADNKGLVMWEPLELGDTPTEYHKAVGEDIASKSGGRITAEQAAEKIREASQQSYDAIPVADRMSKDIKKNIGNDTVVESRVKGPVSSVVKTMKKPDSYPTVKALKDVIGLKVVTPSQEKQRDTVNLLSTKYNPLEVDDFTKDGRPDGYRAIHMTVQDKDSGLMSEIQVKTQNQDRWAIWAHPSLHKNEELPPDFRATIEKNRDGVNAYGRAMSNYFHDIDSGIKAEKPKCPEYIARTVGCL